MTKQKWSCFKQDILIRFFLVLRLLPENIFQLKHNKHWHNTVLHNYSKWNGISYRFLTVLTGTSLLQCNSLLSVMSQGKTHSASLCSCCGERCTRRMMAVASEILVHISANSPPPFSFFVIRHMTQYRLETSWHERMQTPIIATYIMLRHLGGTWQKRDFTQKDLQTSETIKYKIHHFK